jgi:Fe-S-cluster containining protein
MAGTQRQVGMEIHFNCTQCGKCCRDSKLPLTVVEAINWLQRGHQVQLICEASPWPESLTEDDPRAAHFKRRSFAVMSGSVPTRVVVTLVANLAGACPNLLADMRCGIYEDRPLVCRIYPAEINPFIGLKPDEKACPPEAWTKDQPVLQRDGRVMSAKIRQDIHSSRNNDALDADVKRRLCVALNIIDAAVVHEAVLIYSPAAETLLPALAFAMATDAGPDAGPKTLSQWRFVSDRRETIEDLATSGGIALRLGDAAPASYQYLNFKRQALFGPYSAAKSNLS